VQTSSKPAPAKGNSRGKNPSVPSALPVPTRTTKGRKPSAPTPSGQPSRRDDDGDDGDEDHGEDNEDDEFVGISQPRDGIHSMYNYMDAIPRRVNNQANWNDEEEDDEDSDSDDDDDVFGGMFYIPSRFRIVADLHVRYQ